MTENRNQIFADFLKDNPRFVSGQHRQLADWAYDTKYRGQVASGDMTFESALLAARDEALKTLPPAAERHRTNSDLTEACRIVTEMAISRNQPVPTPAARPLESEDSAAAHRVVAELASGRGQKL